MTEMKNIFDVNTSLKGVDYLTKPIRELVTYPDFSEIAFQKIIDISNMTTTQIENINLPGGNNG